MSAEAMFWAWEQELKATTKIVLLALADYNSSRNECYPSAEALAGKCGLSKRQILREVDALKEAGFLTIVKATGRSNRYLLNVKSGDSQSLVSQKEAVPHSHQSSDTQTPVTASHQCHTVTKAVTHSHKSGDSQSPEPKKNLKGTLKDIGSTKRRTRLPENFTLDQDQRQKTLDYWAGKNRPDINLDDQLEKFVDHHTSRGTTMLDWQAAWRTWRSNALNFTRPQNENRKRIDHRLEVSAATYDYERATNF